VDAQGRPTPEFQQKWRKLFQIADIIPDASDAAAMSLLLDKIASSEGDILRRGAAQWGAVSTPGGTLKFLRADGSYAEPDVTVDEADIDLSDVLTNNVSSARHGFAPKLPNDAAVYLDGTGQWSTPAGGGGGGSYGWQAPTNGSMSSSAHATKGHVLIPLAGFMISRLWLRFNPVSGAAYSARLWQLSNLTLDTPLTDAVNVDYSVTGEQTVIVDLGTPTPLNEGIRYAILVSRVDSTDTAVCSIPGSASSVFSVPINTSTYGFTYVDKKSPAIGDVLAAPSSSYIPVGHDFS
jgi:hypothetical protein